jgi:phosphoribosylaminoimidazolecarboxamide formyltransferase / IMP cyclohydrolase
MPQTLRPVTRALLSVSDKTGLVPFAKGLVEQGIALVSTGGTARTLSEAGLAVTDVSDLTRFPEMMDGRVKTLHPAVHGGLLAIRANPEHQAAMLAHGIDPIDLLVVTLYPFEATIAAGRPFAECVEQIDIGGPAMIRAAAKNHDDVAVVVDNADYDTVLETLRHHDSATPLPLRRRLAQKAFARTASYDAAISQWLLEQSKAEDKTADEESVFPAFCAFGGTRIETLRYGENPHQKAAFYRTAQPRFGVASAKQIQGKALSYNNINDVDAAFECVSELGSQTPCVVIVKHANPCGVAQGATLREAYERALLCDPVSAFGGIVALNQRLDAEAAAKIVDIFTEVIVAPEATPEALSILAAKKNLRLILTGGLPDPRSEGLTFRTVSGGFLVQDRDNAVVEEADLRIVTQRAPTAEEIRDLLFAFKVAKHVKSNAIVYARNCATVGIGAGQMSRVDSSRIAAWKAQEAARAAGFDTSLPGSLAHGSLAQGAVVASDAFFPFADGLLAAAEAGATAIIQPGGSVRDDEVIAAADTAGLAMVFTGFRHFRH